MVLNKSCFRKILLYVEKTCIYSEDPQFGRRLHEVTFHEICKTEELKKYTKEDKRYTIQQLFEGRYINGRVIPDGNYSNFNYAFISGLTLSGHEFIDNVRDESIWAEIISKSSKIEGISLFAMSQIASEAAITYVNKMIKEEE